MGQSGEEGRAPSVSPAQLIAQLNAEVEQHHARFDSSIQRLETSMTNFEAGLGSLERNIAEIVADILQSASCMEEP